MREIKFRAWSKELNGFLDITAFECFKGEIDGIFHDGDYIGYDKEDIALMEFTGLQDKNGKEIYESDIVEINSHKYTINYEIGSFMLVRCSDETDMYEQFKNCWNDEVYPLSQFYWENDCEEDLIYQCEVIGNIYTNSELLDK